MPFVAAGSSDVHYVEHGATAADATRTLVVLHGFTADHRMMVAAIEPLLGHRAGWRRLYLDLPGMGHTAAPPGLASTDDVFAVVTAAIDALVTGPFAVAGLSYGGHLALGLVATRPELITGVALFVPVVIAGHAARDVPAPRVLFEEPGLVYPPDGSLAEHGVVRTAETLRRIRDEIEVAVPAGDTAALDRIVARYGGSFPPDAVFDGPTLVVTGRQDHAVGYRDQWNRFERWPRATIAVLDRAGHNLHIEQPALFGALVTDWLDRVEETVTPSS